MQEKESLLTRTSSEFWYRWVEIYKVIQKYYDEEES